MPNATPPPPPPQNPQIIIKKIVELLSFKTLESGEKNPSKLKLWKKLKKWNQSKTKNQSTLVFIYLVIIECLTYLPTYIVILTLSTSYLPMILTH